MSRYPRTLGTHPRAAACALATLCVVAAAVATAWAGGQEVARGDPRPGAGEFWKDPDGNPLPFQTDEEVLEFLRTAELGSIEDIGLGVTDPRSVILHKDGVHMKAALRDYEEIFEELRLPGAFYARLRDSYVFDIAAYGLARVIGLDHIPPVTFRRLGNNQVTLQAWLEGGLMESTRIADGVSPPSWARFRQQQHDMRVFDSVIGNVDRNTGNILMDGNWNFWLIDHSRAFMRNDDTYYLERVRTCSRWLYERLKTLTLEEIKPVMSPPLTASEVDWVLRRRDKVIAHIDALIEEIGDPAVVLLEGGR